MLIIPINSQYQTHLSGYYSCNLKYFNSCMLTNIILNAHSSKIYSVMFYNLQIIPLDSYVYVSNFQCFSPTEIQRKNVVQTFSSKIYHFSYLLFTTTCIIFSTNRLLRHLFRFSHNFHTFNSFASNFQC